MERPTKELKTKSGHKVVLKEWITKAERLMIRGAASQNMEGVYHKDGGNVTIKNLGTRTTEEVTMKVVLLSIDDKTGQGMIDFIFNGMPEWEANEIFDEVNKVTDPELKKK